MADDEFGDDYAGILDLEPALEEATNVTALGQALGRRLTTTRGTLWYDPEYGHDVRQYLNAPFVGEERVAAEVTQECLEDDRVFSVDAVVTFVDPTLTITLTVRSDIGPFELTLTASTLSIDVFIEEAA